MITGIVTAERDPQPAEFLPPLKVDRYFKGAYPVPGTPIFLSLTEGKPAPDGARTAEVEALSEGPNMGSAGGPTLLVLGAIARINYHGLLSTST